jgi:hypothetical protein
MCVSWTLVGHAALHLPLRDAGLSVVLFGRINLCANSLERNVTLTLLDRFAVILGSLALRLAYGPPVDSMNPPKQEVKVAQVDGGNIEVLESLSRRG